MPKPKIKQLMSPLPPETPDDDTYVLPVSADSPILPTPPGAGQPPEDVEEEPVAEEPPKKEKTITHTELKAKWAQAKQMYPEIDKAKFVKAVIGRGYKVIPDPAPQPSPEEFEAQKIAADKAERMGNVKEVMAQQGSFGVPNASNLFAHVSNVAEAGKKVIGPYLQGAEDRGFQKGGVLGNAQGVTANLANEMVPKTRLQAGMSMFSIPEGLAAAKGIKKAASNLSLDSIDEAMQRGAGEQLERTGVALKGWMTKRAPAQGVGATAQQGGRSGLYGAVKEAEVKVPVVVREEVAAKVKEVAQKHVPKAAHRDFIEAGLQAFPKITKRDIKTVMDDPERVLGSQETLEQALDAYVNAIKINGKPLLGKYKALQEATGRTDVPDAAIGRLIDKVGRKMKDPKNPPTPQELLTALQAINERFQLKSQTAALSPAKAQAFGELRDEILDRLDDTLPNLREASTKLREAYAREAFSSWLPKNKYGGFDAARTIAAFISGVHGLARVAQGDIIGGGAGAITAAAVSPKVAGAMLKTLPAAERAAGYSADSFKKAAPALAVPATRTVENLFGKKKNGR